MPNTIKAWSHARWGNFEKCKLRAKLLYVDNIKEAQNALKPGQTELPNERGKRVHEAAERYVRGGVELIPELVSFQAEFDNLRARFASGQVSLEGDWAHDFSWKPVAFFSADAWLRIKIDALVHMSPEWAVVIDYKTGRRNGNELKHAEQTQLYTVSCFMRYPKLERITTELWYPDEPDLARMEYSRDQGMRFFKRWNQRGIDITSTTDFPPNPNKFSCQFCHFGPKDDGPCLVGV